MLIGDLIKEVSVAFDIPPMELLGKCQQQKYIPARFALYTILKNRGMSLKRIGTICSGRDHKTITHGIGRAEWMMARDDIYREKIERLSRLSVDLTMAHIRLEQAA